MEKSVELERACRENYSLYSGKLTIDQTTMKLSGVLETISLYPRNSALYLIRLYQVHLSPIKGYSCAYGRLHGTHTCSSYGVKVVNRFGLINGGILIMRQFQRCREASIIINRFERINNPKASDFGDCCPMYQGDFCGNLLCCK